MSQIIGNYQLGQIIGKGTFGKVCKAIHLPTSFNVAIKILDRRLIVEEQDFERVSRQIRILRKIRHRNVIQLYEVIETETHLYLVTELADHDLFTKIVEKKYLPESLAASYFRQLLNGLQYCHDNNICHRDIKPQNLLISNGQIKITDFGLSNVFDNNYLKTACGSPCYAPPEMLQRKMYDPKMVDIWSSGVTLYAMSFGKLPFDDPNILDLYKKIKKGEFQIPPSSSDLKHLLLQILQINPLNRPTIQQILQHPWLAQSKIELESDEWIVESILQEVTEVYQISKEVLQANLKQNRHNNVTTTYYLSKLIIQSGGTISSKRPKVQISQPKEEQQKSISIIENEKDQNKTGSSQKQNKSPNQNDSIDIFDALTAIQDELPRQPPQQIKQSKPITLRRIARMKPQFMKRTATHLNERSVSRAPERKKYSKQIHVATHKPHVMSPLYIFIGNKIELKQFIQKIQHRQCSIEYYAINTNILYITKYEGKDIQHFQKQLTNRLK